MMQQVRRRISAREVLISSARYFLSRLKDMVLDSDMGGCDVLEASLDNVWARWL